MVATPRLNEEQRAFVLRYYRVVAAEGRRWAAHRRDLAEDYAADAVLTLAEHATRHDPRGGRRVSVPVCLRDARRRVILGGMPRGLGLRGHGMAAPPAPRPGRANLDAVSDHREFGPLDAAIVAEEVSLMADRLRSGVRCVACPARIDPGCRRVGGLGRSHPHPDGRICHNCHVKAINARRRARAEGHPAMYVVRLTGPSGHVSYVPGACLMQPESGGGPRRSFPTDPAFARKWTVAADVVDYIEAHRYELQIDGTRADAVAFREDGTVTELEPPIIFMPTIWVEKMTDVNGD